MYAIGQLLKASDDAPNKISITAVPVRIVSVSNAGMIRNTNAGVPTRLPAVDTA